VSGLPELLAELMALAAAQRDALAGGRLAEALALLPRREEIMTRIQNLDAPRGPGSRGIAEPDAAAIRRILDTDRESVGAVACLLSDAGCRLETIRRIRALSRDAAACGSRETSLTDRSA